MARANPMRYEYVFAVTLFVEDEIMTMRARWQRRHARGESLTAGMQT